MSEISRRELLAGAAAAVGAQDAAHVHHTIAKAEGGYQVKCFKPHEYATLGRLAELIMPGAGEARAPEFIDVLASGSDELAAIFTGGLGWLDGEMRRRHASDFVSATPEQQTGLLDLIAYRKNETPELGPGIRFFVWARNLVVDAYFSSKGGMDYLGYMGNGAVSEFKVPEEAVKYALSRCPV